MKLRIATFNLQNLFSRPSAMAEDAGAAGQRALDDHGELNRLVALPLYDAAVQARLVELERGYGFADTNPPSNALVRLGSIRGRLYAKARDGKIRVVAKGRADWTGWFELRRSDIRWKATYNAARVVAETAPDILIAIEAEDRATLLRFNEQVLGAQFQRAYPHVMLVDGNDDRGIDVGILSRFPIDALRSHVDDRNPNGERTFSRDCPEYVILLPTGQRLVVVPNHFKSKYGGNDAASRRRRLAQAARAIEIAESALAISPLVLLGGDLNDTPRSAELAPLWRSGFKDVQAHASHPKARPGTFGTGSAGSKIDYLIGSPTLFGAMRATGIERRGSYHPRLWKPFDSVSGAGDQASDHHLVWADVELAP